jgi:hypothetical protein
MKKSGLPALVCPALATPNDLPKARFWVRKHDLPVLKCDLVEAFFVIQNRRWFFARLLKAFHPPDYCAANHNESCRTFGPTKEKSMNKSLRMLLAALAVAAVASLSTSEVGAQGADQPVLVA